MEAKVFLNGNLGKDAEVVNFKNGNAVITFSIPSNSYYMKDGERVQTTTWHNCKKFVKEVNPKFLAILKKGANFTVVGNLKYDEYTTDGAKHIRAYIEVEEIS